jgi:glycosyltransferase involved in cell wall biosynthesis
MLQVSVVIPTFNRERFLGHAVQSVLDQTFPPLEIIVVDDGSSDGTEKIARHFSGNVPIFYHRQENHGPGAARNLGVSVAQGEWIAFLDSDDIWYPHKLAAQVNYVEEHPGVSFVYSEMDAIDENGRLTGEVPDGLDFESVIFGGRPFPYPSTVLLKKDTFLKAGGFHPLIRYGEDLELFARIAQICHIHCLPHSLVKYRLHPAQTNTDLATRLRSWPLVLDRIWRMWSGDPPKQAMLLPHFVKYFMDKGKHALITGDYAQARRFFRLAFSYRPCSWKNLRRWGLSYLPGFRDLYRNRKTKPRVP